LRKEVIRFENPARDMQKLLILGFMMHVMIIF